MTNSQDNTKEIEALTKKFASYMDLHLHGSATRTCDLLLSLTNNDPEWSYSLADVWFRSAKYDTALEILAGIQMSHPDKFTSRCAFLAAQCHQRQQDWAKCSMVLDMFFEGLLQTDAATLQTTHGELAAPALHLRGVCLEMGGDRRAAAEVYFRALEVDNHYAEVADRLTCGFLVSASVCRERLAAVVRSPLLLATYTSRIRSLDIVPANTTSTESVVPEVATLAPRFGIGNWMILLSEAQRLHELGCPHRALKITTTLMHGHSHREECLMLHVTVLVSLKRVSELHHTAHALAAKFPSHAVAWYAVGCYYYSIANYEKAGVYFERAMTLDAECMPAWVAYGHCCFYLEEGEQALKAYRNLQRLFPGSHRGCLYMGMQYSRGHSWKTAAVYIEEAYRMCPSDALVLNELGVMAFRAQNYEGALHHLRAAVEMCPYRPTGSDDRDVVIPPPVVCDYWEPIFFNLACAHRKLKHYPEAIQWYEMCLIGVERCSHVYTALGFTHHLSGNLDNAIECYHSALSTKTTDTFAHNMLKLALTERHEAGLPFEELGQHPDLPSTFPSGSAAHSNNNYFGGAGTPSGLHRSISQQTRYSTSYQDIARVINPSPFTRPSTTSTVRTDPTSEVSPLPPLGRQLQF
eukprot:PhM_4_TR9454/c0_g1_i1/m.33279/K03353/APC6, CDC16; anaphase-promoting complex subunit 6